MVVDLLSGAGHLPDRARFQPHGGRLEGCLRSSPPRAIVPGSRHSSSVCRLSPWCCIRTETGVFMAFVPMSVFDDRKKRIQDWLGENGYQALVITTPDNFYMVSGFHLDVAPWERPVAAVIPQSSEPFMIMHELSTNHLRFAEERHSLYITDYSIYVEHPRSTNRTWNRLQWGELLAMRLAERGITRGRIAVEGHGPSALKAASRTEARVRGRHAVPDRHAAGEVPGRAGHHPRCRGAVRFRAGQVHGAGEAGIERESVRLRDRQPGHAGGWAPLPGGARRS